MRTLKLAAVLFVLCLQMPTYAQQRPVREWADWSSYGTALVNPTNAAVHAWRSGDRWCELGQLAIAEGVGNGTALVIKHFVKAERPCLGCAPDGEPSGHSMNATLGYRTSDWRYGMVFAWGTGLLRNLANRHYWYQIGSGILLGVGADWVGHLLKCRE